MLQEEALLTLCRDYLLRQTDEELEQALKTMSERKVPPVCWSPAERAAGTDAC